MARFQTGFMMTPVVKNLIIINFIVWLAMILFPHQLGVKLDQYAALYYVLSPLFNPCQLFTYMFLHSTQGIAHLFFNMFTLWMFGMAIERIVGPVRFLFYYIACGVGAALIQEGVYALMLRHDIGLMPDGGWEYVKQYGLETLRHGQNFSDAYMGSANLLMNIPTVGASGAIYGVLLAFGLIFPNRPLYIMFIPVPVKAKYMVIVWVVMELSLGIGGVGNVAHFCHLGGMVAGLLIFLWWKHKGIINGPYY